MSQTESKTANFEVDCPLCWWNKSCDDDEVAERYVAIHKEETGHDAEVSR